jgi:hypothetical protein
MGRSPRQDTQIKIKFPSLLSLSFTAKSGCKMHGKETQYYVLETWTSHGV